MPNNSKYLGLTLPQGPEYYNVDIGNKNFQTIDEIIEKLFTDPTLQTAGMGTLKDEVVKTTIESIMKGEDGTTGLEKISQLVNELNESLNDPESGINKLIDKKVDNSAFETFKSDTQSNMNTLQNNVNNVQTSLSSETSLREQADKAINDKIGTGELTTVDKTINGAIRELDRELGVLSSLDNDLDKSSLVVAVNQVNNKVKSMNSGMTDINNKLDSINKEVAKYLYDTCIIDSSSMGDNLIQINLGTYINFRCGDFTYKTNGTSHKKNQGNINIGYPSSYPLYLVMLPSGSLTWSTDLALDNLPLFKFTSRSTYEILWKNYLCERLSNVDKTFDMMIDKLMKDTKNVNDRVSIVDNRIDSDVFIEKYICGYNINYQITRNNHGGIYDYTIACTGSVSVNNLHKTIDSTITVPSLYSNSIYLRVSIYESSSESSPSYYALCEVRPSYLGNHYTNTITTVPPTSYIKITDLYTDMRNPNGTLKAENIMLERPKNIARYSDLYKVEKKLSRINESINCLGVTGFYREQSAVLLTNIISNKYNTRFSWRNVTNPLVTYEYIDNSYQYYSNFSAEINVYGTKRAIGQWYPYSTSSGSNGWAAFTPYNTKNNVSSSLYDEVYLYGVLSYWPYSPAVAPSIGTLTTSTNRTWLSTRNNGNLFIGTNGQVYFLVARLSLSNGKYVVSETYTGNESNIHLSCGESLTSVDDARQIANDEFKSIIVCSAIEPTNPKEGTIWFKTSE